MTEVQAFPPAMQRLVRELSKLPSIGQKSAARLGLFLMNNEPQLANNLAKAIAEARQQVRYCTQCFFMTDTELCSICRDSARDAQILCVVEKPVDIIAIERTGGFRGRYHVLHGLWAPLRGMGPDQMRFKELLDRVSKGGVREVILALNSTVEGDATALYIAKGLAGHGISTTRLAQGLPKGGEWNTPMNYRVACLSGA